MDKIIDFTRSLICLFISTERFVSLPFLMILYTYFDCVPFIYKQ